jgi:hypothetical protein
MAKKQERRTLARKDAAERTNSEIIFEVEESPEGGYEARALGHSLYTEADSLEGLRTMVRDAVRCHFEKGSRPRVIRLHVDPNTAPPINSAVAI